MKKCRAKSKSANVKARKARSLWPLVSGLKRRPVAGDVLIGKAMNDNGKRLVWHFSKTGVRHVPYDTKEPDYIEGTIYAHALDHYQWLENRRGISPS